MRLQRVLPLQRNRRGLVSPGTIDKHRVLDSKRGRVMLVSLERQVGARLGIHGQDQVTMMGTCGLGEKEGRPGGLHARGHTCPSRVEWRKETEAERSLLGGLRRQCGPSHPLTSGSQPNQKRMNACGLSRLV